MQPPGHGGKSRNTTLGHPITIPQGRSASGLPARPIVAAPDWDSLEDSGAVRRLQDRIHRASFLASWSLIRGLSLPFGIRAAPQWGPRLASLPSRITAMSLASGSFIVRYTALMVWKDGPMVCLSTVWHCMHCFSAASLALARACPVIPMATITTAALRKDFKVMSPGSKGFRHYLRERSVA